MALFNWHITASPTLTETPNVKKIKFGDGYEQRFTNGINSTPQSWSVSFSNRLENEAVAIRDFLRSHGGVLSFDWQPPGENRTYKFTCSSWNLVPHKGGVYSMSTTFEQVFDP